ncbi:ComEC/Rec2 family competence protein [Flavobacterium alkalisoli]|uniref:ComEC/Rec2 family competence protein n=1 Tax=Flavobacterium alkalisoli TaxID=2602769 RepID=UPI003A8F9593
MTVKFFRAECGDAASIRYYGNDSKFHNIFIDSGYERTFRHILEDEIKNIIELGERIDLWVISHIHDDHIGGVLKYIDTIKSGEFEDIVDQFFYNPPRKYSFNVSPDPISKPVSINQGDILYEYLKSTNKLLDIKLTRNISPIDKYGLNITVLSPDSDKLNKLHSKYPLGSSNMLEKEEDESSSDAISQATSDHHLQLDDFNVLTMKEDTSIENGSSISIITEYKGASVLWLADSHPSNIVSSLRSLGISEFSKLNVDVVKVSHHGSAGNNSTELYSLINCNKYVFSVNGENKYHLPAKECIARILKVPNRNTSSEYSLYFTHNDDILKSIFDADNNGIEKYNFSTIFSAEKEIVFEF